MQDDKQVEQERYDSRAKQLLSNSEQGLELLLGSQMMPMYLRSPYLQYEKCISSLIHSGARVLEIGAGSGMHTTALLLTGAQVVATDISSHALALLAQRLRYFSANLETCQADMESLPFESNTFDVVACAGSLSYGYPLFVNAEIKRVLKGGGLLVCVDSLNHNPIYRFNRYFHYIRGNRSKSTLNRMPTLNSISQLTAGFNKVEINYYGAITFFAPMLLWFFNEKMAHKVVDWFDRVISVKRSAFKFVVVAQDYS